MTPEDQQRKQQNNPAVLKAQADAAHDDKDFKQKQALIDQKAEANLAGKVVMSHTESNLDRATNEIERQAVEKAGTGPAVAGVPGSQGFGSNTAA